MTNQKTQADNILRTTESTQFKFDLKMAEFINPNMPLAYVRNNSNKKGDSTSKNTETMIDLDIQHSIPMDEWFIYSSEDNFNNYVEKGQRPPLANQLSPKIEKLAKETGYDSLEDFQSAVVGDKGPEEEKKASGILNNFYKDLGDKLGKEVEGGRNGRDELFKDTTITVNKEPSVFQQLLSALTFGLYKPKTEQVNETHRAFDFSSPGLQNMMDESCEQAINQQKQAQLAPEQQEQQSKEPEKSKDEVLQEAKEIGSELKAGGTKDLSDSKSQSNSSVPNNIEKSSALEKP